MDLLWRCIGLDKRIEVIVNGVTGAVSYVERKYTPEEIAEAKAAQEEYEKHLASQLPTYEERLSALESALLEMITGGETSG